MKLSVYRSTCTRARWSDPESRGRELRILFARSEARFWARYA